MKPVVLLPLILLLACSQNPPVPSKHEQNYLQTRDSLIKYKSLVLEISTDSITETIDFINLDYATYKEKYHASDSEMDLICKSLNTRCEIAKTLKAIKDNMRLLEFSNNKIAPKNRLQKNYSFNKDQIPSGSKISTKEDIEAEVLRDAIEKEH